MRSLALLAATAASLTSAYAAFPVGDGEAFLTGTASYSQTDNLYLSKVSTKSTAVATFTPGISVEFGGDALAKNILSFSEQFVRYASASSQNNELFNAKYDGSYSDDKSKITFGAAYVESAQNNRDARLNGIIVENTTESINAGFDWTLSPKTSFNVNPSWENSDYSTLGFTDRTSWTLPLNFAYEIAPKLKSTGGYRYRNDSQKAGPDSTDHFFNLGATGEFTPQALRLAGGRLRDPRHQALRRDQRQHRIHRGSDLQFRLQLFGQNQVPRLDRKRLPQRCHR